MQNVSFFISEKIKKYRKAQVPSSADLEILPFWRELGTCDFFAIHFLS